MPRWPLSTSNAPSSTASGTTPSHQTLIRQITRLFRDVPLVFGPMRDRPPTGVLDWTARRLCGAEALQGRQSLHPLAPGTDRREVRVHGLRFGREAEAVNDRQHVDIRES